MTETTPQRTALITGAAVRVGAAMARALAADGWHVAINYHNSHYEAQHCWTKFRTREAEVISCQVTCGIRM